MSFSSIVSKAGNLPSQVIADKRSQVSPAEARLRFPTGEFVNYGMMFKFMKYQYDLNGNKSQFTNNIQGAHIFLPLPSNLMENMNINYNNNDLGAAGILYATGFQNGSSALAAANKAISGMSDSPDIGASAEAAAKMGVSTSAYVARRVISDLSSETGASLDLSTGTVANPYTVATFHNISLRTFSLNFKLIPQSPEDSRMIKRICDQFKYHALPSKSQNGLFLQMPEELEIVFYGSEFLFKFARCVLTGVTVNHAPLGPASFFNDGAPTAVELSLSLQEVEQITKESYQADASFKNETEGA